MGQSAFSLIQEGLQILMDLGLTLLQAKIYFTLVETGTAKVKNISQVSRVSRPDVYRTLSKLQELGLIEKEITNPVMFRAIPTEIVIESLLNRKKKKYDELQSKTKFLISNLKNNYIVNSSQGESQFVFVPSKEALIKKLKKAIDSAQKSIDVVTTSKRFIYACYCLSGSLEKAWQRNVKGRVIIENPEKLQTEIFEKTWRKPWADIRIVSTVPPTVIDMYDNKEVFIFTKPAADLKDSPALWSNDPSIICLTQHYFELMWINALDIKNIQKLS